MSTAAIIFGLLAVVGGAGWALFFWRRYEAEKELLACRVATAQWHRALAAADEANRRARNWMLLCVFYAFVLVWVAVKNPGLILWGKR